MELAEDCEDHEVHAGYRRKALQLHPDRGGSDEQFRLLRESYDVIETSRSAMQGPADEKEGAQCTACGMSSKCLILIPAFVQSLAVPQKLTVT